ncbi:hypothetical protein R6U77_14825 [Lysinibacillus louembei]|uniref:Uncharacterized protein n=1 Tax=Lysinibacillus louembei TaxID=1470088 RepID=A0ABZ0RWC2_9BACI|nr:hypothetical protein [Lysinibacillus louembei]WPK11150.1 hypothetical protein R6U77_14825 [Lysinibacillus louembei]
MKNTKLRIIWMIPNIFCYLMLLGFATFVFIKAEGLMAIDRLTIWVIALFALLFVSLFGSYRIWTWIKEGKM